MWQPADIGVILCKSGMPLYTSPGRRMDNMVNYRTLSMISTEQAFLEFVQFETGAWGVLRNGQRLGPAFDADDRNAAFALFCDSVEDAPQEHPIPLHAAPDLYWRAVI